jgi:phenylalanine-4-hydroxylase
MQSNNDVMKIFSKEALVKRGVLLQPDGELIHNGPLAIPQAFHNYTEDEHALWSFLFEKQLANLSDIAYSPWLAAMETIGLTRNAIPQFSAIAEITVPLTGWIPVPISGYLDPRDYFCYLAKRQFPTVAGLRPRERWEFQIDPDLFHDAFGHLPMHIRPELADFLQLFGEVAARAKNSQQLTELERLYWFTVEYGLIKENGRTKVCGSGHLSGFKEAQYSLSDAVLKNPFKLEEVIAQNYNPHILQEKLFILDSYEQLFDSMRELGEKYGLL